jgi:hypothetical protein
VLKYIPKGAVMIELGSYWGYYSLWFSTKVPDATNWLIEPDPANMKVGMKNFSLNEKTAHFINGYIPMCANDVQTFKQAKKIYIDTFLKNHNIEHVAILHSDIQGAEVKMLESCKKSLRNQKIDYLFVSTHTQGIHASCKKIIVESGYLIISEHDMNESCSVDGLIVARRRNIEGPNSIPVRKYTHD